MSFRVVFTCNSCGVDYTTDYNMEFPPHWIAIQLAISNEEGQIPDHEQHAFMHFCRQKCLTEYAKSDELKERILVVDSTPDDMSENDDDQINDIE